MSYTKAPISYDDIRPTLDRALESERGIQLRFKSKHDSHRWVCRANAFRGFMRLENRKMFPDPEDVRGMQSEYDKLVIRRPKLIEADYIVIIQPVEFAYAIEEILEL